MSEKINYTERNKYLTIAIGKCWHEPHTSSPYHDDTISWHCKCGMPSKNHIPRVGFGSDAKPEFKQYYDFSSGDGMQILKQWLDKKENNYLNSNFFTWAELHIRSKPDSPYWWWWILLDPDTFADTLYEFLKERG
jgi:hypothetical protein